MSDPAALPPRLTELDAIRGLAVMGILLMNIISFSMPFGAYVNPLSWGGTSVADMTVWTVNQLLFEGRMRGLFALLFGVSALLVMERGDARDAVGGGNGTAIHMRRMVALALLGFLHSVLIWDGDILLHYALLGLLIPFLRPLPPGKSLALAATLLIVTTIAWSVAMGGALYLEHQANGVGVSPGVIEQARVMMEGFPVPGDAGDVADLELLRGGYGPILAHRFGNAPGLIYDLLYFLGPETLSFMMIGMALWQTGFFTGGWDDRQLKRLMIWCYAISMPVLALLTWWAFASGFDPIVMMGDFVAWAVPFRVIGAVGHLALAMLIVRRLQGSAMVARIAATGRMALSNYLATSIVMTTVFYGYGFGLFGQVERAPLYGFVIAMWAAMLLWSKPWLDRFAYGPFEWLWRSLSRMELQPMRRSERR